MERVERNFLNYFKEKQERWIPPDCVFISCVHPLHHLIFLMETDCLNVGAVSTNPKFERYSYDKES